jgi:hypothetical protein
MLKDALNPEVALAALLSVFLWVITGSHRQLKATCVMALMLIWYAWVPVVLQPELPSTAATLWLTRLTVLAMTSAVVLASLIHRFPPRLRLIESDPSTETSYRTCLALGTFVSVLVAAAYLAQLRSVPILAAPEDRPEAREAATTTLPFYRTASLALNFLLPLAWCGWIMAGRIALGVSLFVFAILAVAATGQKAPIAYQAFMMLLLAAQRARRFPYGSFFLLTLVVAGVLLALVYVHNFGYVNPDAETINASAEGLIRRSLSVPAEVIDGWTSCFPAQHPFVGFGETEVPMDQLVYEHMNPSSPYKGTANGPFFLEIYARFGDSAGIVFAAVTAISLGFALLDLSVLARPRSIATAAAYPLLCLGAARLAITDVRTAIIGIVLSILAMWGCMVVAEQLRTPNGARQRGVGVVRSPVLAVLGMVALAYLVVRLVRSVVGDVP